MSVKEEGKSRAESPEERRDWCVYLLACADGTLYCGVTSDLERRLACAMALAEEGLLPFSQAQLAAAIDEWRSAGFPAQHHTDAKGHGGDH